MRRYLGLVYHAALRQLGGEAHASEDVAQRVFALLARKAPSLGDHAALAGWLHTTTRFTASETLRAERRRRAREQEAFTMHQPTNDNRPAAADSAWTDLRPVIDEALGELDAPDREAVLLRYFAGLPHAQIGARLAISENAARMRVERALEKLHGRLARRGVTSTASALGVVLANQVGAATAALPAGLAGSVTSAALAGSAAAGAAGAAASAAGFFGFMSTAKIVTGLAVVVGIAGLGSAFHERNHAAQAEATLAALRREAEELRGQAAQNQTLAREANERSQASEARVAALQKEVASARSAARAATAAEPVSRPTASRPVTVDPMLSNPEYFQLSMQKYRADLRQKFGLLYKSLHLSDEQIAKFESNRTDSYQAMMEIVSSADAQGTSTADASVSKLMTEAIGPIDSEFVALLGRDGYQLYLQHNRTQAALGVIKDLAGTVYRTDSPLTPVQGEQLAQALIAQTRAVPYSPGSRSTAYVTDWSAVADQARVILSPSQVTAFQSLLDARILQDRMMAISRAFRDPPASSPKK
ncbi:MAG: sigma-70 family RNA polymerase sigma factor [Opitutaceae bacterium]|nr:sigma-70 family RNA polymerase sigma factor [Opitutaceae bacterium]